MSRQAVRSLKKGMRGAGPRPPGTLPSTECAIALLERSIAFGHRRLAVVRLFMAATLGAPISPDHWSYCFRVVNDSADLELQDIYRLAASRAQTIPLPNSPH